MIFKNLEQGKLYTITWLDPEEDPRGHPSEAICKVFIHTYRFHQRKFVSFERKRVPVLVFTVGQSPDFYHSFACPESLILKVEEAK